jgi:hypothetical protein
MNLSGIRQLALVCLLFISITSCASILTGICSEVHFESTPPGASIMIGDEEFTTPFSTNLFKCTKRATFTHSDNGLFDIDLDRDSQSGRVLMDFLLPPELGISGIFTDGASSAFYKLPTIISFEFKERQVLAVEAPKTRPQIEQLKSKASGWNSARRIGAGCMTILKSKGLLASSPG